MLPLGGEVLHSRQFQDSKCAQTMQCSPVSEIAGRLRSVVFDEVRLAERPVDAVLFFPVSLHLLAFDGAKSHCSRLLPCPGLGHLGSGKGLSLRLGSGFRLQLEMNLAHCIFTDADERLPAKAVQVRHELFVVDALHFNQPRLESFNFTLSLSLITMARPALAVCRSLLKHGLTKPYALRTDAST